jgi:LppX_LprAFG lipoprotein
MLSTAAAASALLIVAACGGSSGATSQGPAKPHPHQSSSGQQPQQASSQSPEQIVEAAAVKAASLRSAVATIREQVSGAQATTISGVVHEQLKPTLEASLKLHVAGAGQTAAIGEILTTKAIYIKVPGLAQQVGKPWIKLTIADLRKSNSALGALYGSLSKLNPAAQSGELAGATDVQAAGTDVVNGVSTTKYTGTVQISAALHALPKQLRKSLKPDLQQITGGITFTAWIDGQGQLRKEVITESVAGEQVTITVTLSGLNQPVHLAIPPASQVATPPPGALG